MNNNILKNYKPTANINRNNPNYFHIIALFYMIDGGRVEGSITITNKRIIMEYRTRFENNVKEEYPNDQ